MSTSSTRWGLAPGPGDLRQLLAAAVGGMDAPDFIVKVNWFSPHPGNYTGAVALDRLLAALPGPATVVEGHSSGRTDGSRWLGPGQAAGAARDWLREQEREFLRATGLRAVLDRHGAAYLNVTEEAWAGRTVDAGEVARAVGGPLVHPELLGCVPQALYERRERSSFINFARLKLPAAGGDGAYSLGLKNLFGLIPEPDRTAYHGDLPTSILDIGRVYHALFTIVTVCEGLENGILFRTGGAYKAPWGDYDLLTGAGPLAIAGANPLEVDAVAAAIFGVTLEDRTLFREAARFFPPCSESVLAQARSYGRERGLAPA